MCSVALTEPATSAVLVVDDEAPVRDILRRWLEPAGFKCLDAGGADRAWELLQHHDVSLVASDITMPGRNGLSLLARIRQFLPQLPVMMMTAVDDRSTAVEAMSLGAFGYLVKPLQREDFLAHVNRGLRKRRSELESNARLKQLEATVHQQSATIHRADENVVNRLLRVAWWRDEETTAHIRRTGLFCQAFAEALAWTNEESNAIRLASAMHDIGKIGIPDSILRKPGMLTADEFEIMQNHTLIGSSMLAGADTPVLKLAQEIALNHHERWDGTGYPNGLHERHIPAAARIASIVDVYDALTHDRIYRPALTEADALAIMEKGNASQFDPQLFGTFVRLLPVFRRISAENPDDNGINMAQLVSTTSPAAVQLVGC